MTRGVLGELYRQRAHDRDIELVEACLGGDERAWHCLVDKYKNLIVSIPVKRGLPADAVSDVFQNVCLELYRNLERIREPKALAGWLIRVTSNACYHWRRREARYVQEDGEDRTPDPSNGPEDLLQELESAQYLRDAVAGLPKRCRALVRMLFYESPPRPYEEVAEALGLARGSMSLTRQRCLAKLRRSLEDGDFL